MKLSNALQSWAQTSYTAISSGFQGLMNSSQQHQQASEDLMGQAHLDLARQQDHGITVSISEAYHERLSSNPSLERTPRSAESSVASINEAGITYSASAKLVRASSSMLDALFNAVA